MEFLFLAQHIMKSKHNKQFTTQELVAFVKNELDEARCVELKNALASDDELKQTLLGIQAFLANETETPEDFLATLPTLHITNITQPKGRVTPLKWLAAASILIAVALAIYTSISKPVLSDYEYKDAGIPITLSENKPQFLQAMQAYKLEDYALSLQQIEADLVQFGSNDTLLYYAGVNCKALQQYEKAINYFSALQQPNATLKQKADYQLLLSYLHTNNRKKAIAQINTILSNKTHLFYDKALEIKQQFF